MLVWKTTSIRKSGVYLSKIFILCEVLVLYSLLVWRWIFSHLHIFTICTLCMYVCELRAFFVIIGRQFPNWIPIYVLIKTNWQISDPKFLKLIRFQFPLTTYLVSFRFDAELVRDKLCWAIIRKTHKSRNNRQMETEVLSHACRQWADFNLVSSQILINLAFINIYGNIFV